MSAVPRNGPAPWSATQLQVPARRGVARRAVGLGQRGCRPSRSNTRGCRRCGRCAASRQWIRCTRRTHCRGRPRTRPRARAARARPPGPARRRPARRRARGGHGRRCRRCRRAISARRGAVHLDRARQASAAARRRRRSCPRRREPRAPAPATARRPAGIRSTRSNSPVDINDADEPDGEHRPDAHDVLRDELRPRAERRVLPAAAHGRQRELGELGGPVEVAGRERVPDRVGRVVVLGDTRRSPGDAARPARRGLRRGAARAARRRRGGGTDTTRVDRRAESRTGSPDPTLRAPPSRRSRR